MSISLEYHLHLCQHPVINGPLFSGFRSCLLLPLSSISPFLFLATNTISLISGFHFHLVFIHFCELFPLSLTAPSFLLTSLFLLSTQFPFLIFHFMSLLYFSQILFQFPFFFFSVVFLPVPPFLQFLPSYNLSFISRTLRIRSFSPPFFALPPSPSLFLFLLSTSLIFLFHALFFLSP